MTIEFQVTIDCHDPARLAEFWAYVTGGTVQAPPEGYDSWPDALSAWGVPEENWNDRSAVIDPEGTNPRLFFQRIPEAKQVKNRLHLDLRVAPGVPADERMSALNAIAEELVERGAKILNPQEATGIDQALIVMADPEGNEFCLD